MLEELKIDPEFEKVIPPLTKDEYQQLKCCQYKYGWKRQYVHFGDEQLSFEISKVKT